MSTWLTAQAFAEAAGMSVQAARKVLKIAADGQCWRGVKLQVRWRLGRGGRGGLIYEVSAASLPIGIAAAPAPRANPQDPANAPSRRATDHGRTLQHLAAIEPILRTRARSAERREALHLASTTSDVTPRTIYRWVQLYKRDGVRGLARVRPANAGKRRVEVSRRFDRAWRVAGHDDAGLKAIGEEVARNLKGLWISRAEAAGSTEIRRMAEFMLRELVEAQGKRLPPAALRLSRRHVERFAHYRVVNQWRNDRKAFNDAKPRIRRDWTALAPMERVVADVKHLDVLVSRPDGEPAWPKIIAFMDAGTGRSFIHPVLLERGEGVRQEHVIEAFLAMVADRTWGFPQGLYLDNGSEFGALVKIDGALQLLNDAGARTIIHARPYNASAKPIESLFARLDRYVFALLPGYAGPDRLAKKTQTLGRPPKPYPGTWAEFCDTLQGLIAEFNQRPMGGLWADRSPQDWFEQKRDAGWGPAFVDDCELDAAFSDPDSRRVDRGVLKIGGKRYTHERLAALPSRTVVDLALPWRRQAAPLARLDGRWVSLEPEPTYPARWIEGAHASDRRQAQQRRHVSGLAKDAPRIDPVAVKLRMAPVAPSPIWPAGPALDLGGEVRDRASALRDVALARRVSPSDARRVRERELTERLEREQGEHP